MDSTSFARNRPNATARSRPSITTALPWNCSIWAKRSMSRASPVIP